jgi:ATP-binding cassette subfamily B protein
MTVYTKALRKHLVLVAIVVLASIGLQLTQLAAPLFLRQLFNTIAQATPSPEIVSSLIHVLGFLALMYVLEWVARRIGNFAIMMMETRVMADLSTQAFEYLMAHSQQFFANQFTGTLTRRVRKLADAFETIADNVFLQFLPAVTFIVGAIWVLWQRNAMLGMALLVWAVIITILQVQLARWRQPLRVAASEEESKVSGALADAISNQTTVTLFSGQHHEHELFRKAVEQWRKVTNRSWTADEVIWSALGIVFMLTEISVLWLAIHLWQQGGLTVGDFILIQAYLITTFDRLVFINMNLRRFFSALADASEMVEILEEPHGVKDLPDARPLNVIRGEVAFRQVDFGFHDGSPVMRDYSMVIPGGLKVALVGPSGAGKSTVTKLLLRFYDVNAGAVEIDDQNIRTVTQESLRAAIGYVPQEPILFHRTLMENIRYGRRDATDEEVIAAAKQAHAHEFISSFKDGYQTYVGERGVKLSGGERQRVAIARAILKNAPILILDEATSSLDSESEHYIQEALDTLMQGKTVIVIAHRLSTIMKMDRIVVMEDGAIVAKGTHDELLAQRGLYHKLWSIQAGGFLGGEEEKDETEDNKDTIEV